MKRLLSILLAAVFVVTLAGCQGQEKEPAQTPGGSTAQDNPSTAGDAPAEGPLKVGLSFVSLNFPYYVRMYEQFMDEATQRGWEVSFVDGNLDAGTQLNGIQDMINNDVDVMVVSTWFIDAMEDVFEQCNQKNIPVFIIGNTQNPDVITDLIVYACGTEHYDAGYLGGAWTAGYLGDEGRDAVKMVIMSGSTEQMKQRGQGFVDAMTERGIAVEVLNEYDVSAREDAMANAEDALTVYSDLDLIYGVSAQGSLGAYDATVGANRTEVLVVGYDGEEEELQLIDQKGNYIATITQDPGGEASATIEHIEKYLGGVAYDLVVPIPAGIYCAQGQLSADQVLAG